MNQVCRWRAALVSMVFAAACDSPSSPMVFDPCGPEGLHLELQLAPSGEGSPVCSATNPCIVGQPIYPRVYLATECDVPVQVEASHPFFSLTWVDEAGDGPVQVFVPIVPGISGPHLTVTPGPPVEVAAWVRDLEYWPQAPGAYVFTLHGLGVSTPEHRRDKQVNTGPASVRVQLVAPP